MISTPTNDLRVLRSIDIGFFRYNSDRKLWEVVLNNQVPLLLKKKHHSTSDNRVRSLLCADTSILYHQY